MSENDSALIFTTSPRAIRDDIHIKERFRSRAAKAYEKYKIEMEVRKVKNATITAKSSVESSEAMGMYFVDPYQNKKMQDNTPESFPRLARSKENFMMEFVKFFKNMYLDMQFTLTWKQFMCIAFTLQVPIWYIMKHIDMMYKWGALSVLLAFIVIGGAIAMPVYMIFLFMGNYSRRSFISFWECVPILKGVSYSIALLNLLQEILNLSFASLSLDYLWDVFSSNQFPWKDCKFTGSTKNCYSTPTSGYNKSCCTRNAVNCTDSYWAGTVFKYAAYDYYISHQMEMKFLKNSKSDAMPLPHMIFATIVWIMIFFMMAIGLKRHRSVTTTITITILAIIFIPMTILTLFYSDRNMFTDLQSDYTRVFSIIFWLDISSHTLHKEIAGDIITFGAISTPGISTTVDAMCLYTLKLLFLILLTVWVSIGVTMLKTYYNVVNNKCIAFNGVTVIYAIFPDLLSRLPLAKMFLIFYFGVLFFWCFSTSTFTLTALLLSIMEEFPKLMKIKAIFCAVFCAGACALTLLSMQLNLEYFYSSWYAGVYLQVKVTIFLFSLVGVHIYTLGRISNDYHFTYGRKLNVYWLHGVRVAMLLVSIVVIVKTVANFNKKTFTIPDIMLCLVIAVPPTIGAIIVYVRYKSGLRKTLINPDPAWGPPTYKKKVERSKFDPKRALRYKSSTQNCKHNCLIYSKLLQLEIKYWETKCLMQRNERES